MIPSKYTFRTQEVQLHLPKQGTKTYAVESINYINYVQEIYCTCKKEVSIAIQSDENQPYVRLVNLLVKNNAFIFSGGSFAMQDIIKRTASIYNNLSLKVSYEGEIIAIDNIDTLLSTWIETKAYIKGKYKGNQVERFIFRTDKILNSEKESINEISLYHNYGGLIKAMYRTYSSDSFALISQQLYTKYGKIELSEEVLLQSANENGDIQLQLQAHHPEHEEYVCMNGTYNFIEQKEESWLKRAVISSTEKYGRQEYCTSINIMQL